MSVAGRPERIGEQEAELGLLEVDDVAEVVGDEVGERDRDERVRERRGRAGGRCARARRSASPGSRPRRSRRRGEGDGEDRSCSRSAAPATGSIPPSSEGSGRASGSSSFSTPSWAPSNVVPPIETRTRASEPAIDPAQVVEAESGRRSWSRPSSHRERREAGEHPEVLGEGLAAIDPALDPEQGHRRERDRRVDERRDRDVARREADEAEAGLAPDELEEEVADQPGDGGPAAEPLGVLERRRARFWPTSFEKTAGDGAADRAPGVEGAEDVAEEDARRRSVPRPKVTTTNVTAKFRSGAAVPSRPA